MRCASGARCLWATTLDLNGLTGKLRYDGSYPVIERTLLPAEYRNGVPVAV